MSVFKDIEEERVRQDELWGEQNHPSISTIIKHFSMPTRYYCIPSEAVSKGMYETAKYHGELSWVHIALEEFCEAVSAPSEEDRRGELVQLAAVIVAWIECIDRRAAK